MEQHAEVGRAAGVSALVGAPVGGLGALHIPALVEQHAEVARAAGVSALVGAPPGGLGPLQIPTLR